jgi:WD40 repeat protein
MRKGWLLGTALTALLLRGVADSGPPKEEDRPKPLFVLRGHTDAVLHVLFSPCGKHLATASRDRTAALWDANTGKKRFTLEGHTESVRDLSFGPEGRLATGGYDRTVRVWDTATGRALATFSGQPAGLYGVAFGPRSNYLTSGGRLRDNAGEVVIRDPHTGKEVAAIRPLGAAVTSLAYGPGGRRLAAGLWDGKVVVWETASMAAVLAVGEAAPSVPVWSVAFSPDGRRLAATGWRALVRVWSLASGREVRTLKGHAGQAVRASFSPDGRWLASAGVLTRRAGQRACEGEVIVWDAATGEKRFTLALPGGEGPYDLCFSPDGTRLATAHDDGTVKVWSVGQLLGRARRGGRRAARGSSRWVPSTSGLRAETRAGTGRGGAGQARRGMNRTEMVDAFGRVVGAALSSEGPDVRRPKRQPCRLERKG